MRPSTPVVGGRWPLTMAGVSLSLFAVLAILIRGWGPADRLHVRARPGHGRRSHPVCRDQRRPAAAWSRWVRNLFLSRIVPWDDIEDVTFPRGRRLGQARPRGRRRPGRHGNPAGRWRVCPCGGRPACAPGPLAPSSLTRSPGRGHDQVCAFLRAVRGEQRILLVGPALPVGREDLAVPCQPPPPPDATRRLHPDPERGIRTGGVNTRAAAPTTRKREPGNSWSPPPASHPVPHPVCRGLTSRERPQHLLGHQVDRGGEPLPAREDLSMCATGALRAAATATASVVLPAPLRPSIATTTTSPHRSCVPPTRGPRRWPPPRVGWFGNGRTT